MPRDQDAINDHAEERLAEALQRAYEQATEEHAGGFNCELHSGEHDPDDYPDCAAAIQARAEELMEQCLT